MKDYFTSEQVVAIEKIVASLESGKSVNDTPKEEWEKVASPLGYSTDDFLYHLQVAPKVLLLKALVLVNQGPSV